MTSPHLPVILSVFFLLPFSASGTGAAAGSASVTTPPPSVSLRNSDVRFSPQGDIISVTGRYRQTTSSPVLTRTFEGPAEGFPLVRLFDQRNRPFFSQFEVRKYPDSSVIATFSNDSQSVVWRFSPDGYTFSLSGKGVFFSDTLSIDAGTTAVSRGSRTRTLALGKRRVWYTDPPSRTAAVRWFGIRDHFWTLLVKPSSGIAHVTTGAHPLTAVCSAHPQQLTLYAGPVEFFSLRKAGKECTRLLYPVWFWMRWLSIALLGIFTLLLSTTGNCVLSIVLLSLCVKLLIAPLYRIAARWQSEVNRQRSTLEPRLAEINRTCKGEEHTRRVLEVHKELGISPLYALKSLLSAAIQIPVFFAAYHMLSEHIALSGIPFLWIRDLSLPDHLFALPFPLPWFGGYFNILPFVMTSVTILTSCIHSDASLSAELHKRQRASLLVMAALFFMLLYTSPAGMLLYWTMNNLFAFMETSFSAVRRKRPTRNRTEGIV